MGIQIILVLACALALGVSWRRARQRVIPISEAIGWSILWFGAIIVVLLPNVTTKIAHVVGVGRGADLAIYVSVVLLFLVVFRLYILHERLERKITDIVRDNALREITDVSKSS